ncbi:hypothetical protein [Arachidicoccus soli]|uniref:Carboxypeptidase-like regulatory domain-containing protein n=1 Tax=Arachidicoccus soli TaxID=2341117 RepID=A0A386HUK7_9BACT|nr:hypothetical protein [Arachidicoccus soli]AYD49170.1 hypothetical protein D6B99_17005 [Arachidicoccus soli]
MKTYITIKALSIALILCYTSKLCAQTSVKGYVYEDKYRTPIDSVEVYSYSGNKTISKADGSYIIPVTGLKDSIWFRYNNKNTIKYAIDTIKNTNNFEVRIYLPNYLKQDNILPTVTVETHNYIKDSIFLRNFYSKIFNWKKPSQALGEGVSVTPTGVGVDLDALVNMFRFGYNKRQEVYHKFALQIEQDRYIDHRFTKEKVEALTGLYDTARDEYMKLYRPQYQELLLMNDIELGRYIQITYKKYIKYKQQEKIEDNIFLSPEEK